MPNVRHDAQATGNAHGTPAVLKDEEPGDGADRGSNEGDIAVRWFPAAPSTNGAVRVRSAVQHRVRRNALTLDASARYYSATCQEVR